MRSDTRSAIKAGIFVVVCGLLLIASIVVLGQRSQLFTRQYRLVTEFRDAKGLMPGSDVRLAGVTAGTVRSVFVRRNHDGQGRVRVGLAIMQSYHPMITRDSIASIKTLGPLGDKYVEISLGSPDTQELAPGDFLKSEETEDFYEIAKQARETFEQANAIAGQVTKALEEFNRTGVIQEIGESAKSLRRMAEQGEKGDSLLHSLLYDEKLPVVLDDLRATAKTLRTLADQVKAGEGDFGSLLKGDQLQKTLADLKAASESARRILKEVESGDGTAHRLVYDARELEAIAAFAEVGERLNSILKDVEEGKGTLGRLVVDPELWETMKRVLGGVEESRVLKYLIRRQSAEE